MGVFNKIEEILRKVLPPSQSADLDLSETITDYLDCLLLNIRIHSMHT